MTTSLNLPIAIPFSAIEAFCEQHHIRRMSLFGSVLRDDFTPQSDIDVLVEFEPGHTPGLIRLELMQMELARLLGRAVDLLTPKSLHPFIRGPIEASAHVIYDPA